MVDENRIVLLRRLEWVPEESEGFKDEDKTPVRLDLASKETIPAAQKLKDGADEDARGMHTYGVDHVRLEADADATKIYKDKTIALQTEYQRSGSQQSEFLQEAVANRALAQKLLDIVMIENENGSTTLRERLLNMTEALGVFPSQGTNNGNWLIITDPELISVLDKTISKRQPDEGGQRWKAETITQYILHLHREQSKMNSLETTLRSENDKIRELAEDKRSLQADNDDLRRQLESVPEIAELNAGLEKARKTEAKTLDAYKEAQKDIERLRQDIKSRDNRISQLKIHEQASSNLEEYRRTLNRPQSEWIDLTERLAGLSMQHDETQDLLKEKEEALRQQHDEWQYESEEEDEYREEDENDVDEELQEAEQLEAVREQELNELNATVKLQKQLNNSIMSAILVEGYALPAPSVMLLTQLKEDDIDVTPIDLGPEQTVFCSEYSTIIPTKPWMKHGAQRSAFLYHLAHGGQSINTGLSTTMTQLIWIEQRMMPDVQIQEDVSSDVLLLYNYLSRLLLDRTTSSLEFAIATSLIQALHKRFPTNNKDPSRYPLSLFKDRITSLEGGLDSFTGLEQACIIQLAQIWAFKDQNVDIFGPDEQIPGEYDHPVDTLITRFKNDGIGSDDCSFTFLQGGKRFYIIKDRTGEYLLVRNLGSRHFSYCGQWTFFGITEKGEYAARWGNEEDQEISWKHDSETQLGRYMAVYHSLDLLDVNGKLWEERVRRRGS